MKYKAVIFDLDDTLVTTSVVKWAHHKEVAKRFYGIELTDETLKEHWGKPFEPMMAILYQNSDTPENMLAANLSIEHKYRKQRIPGALETLGLLLKNKIEVGVLTSINSNLAEKDLRRLDFPIERFFIIQGANDTAVHKPDPRVFDRAIALLANKGIERNETIYIGDALMDFIAARDAGLDFIGVPTGFVSVEEFEAAGASTAKTISEIPAILGLNADR